MKLTATLNARRICASTLETASFDKFKLFNNRILFNVSFTKLQITSKKNVILKTDELSFLNRFLISDSVSDDL